MFGANVVKRHLSKINIRFFSIHISRYGAKNYVSSYALDIVVENDEFLYRNNFYNRVSVILLWNSIHRNLYFFKVLSSKERIKDAIFIKCFAAFETIFREKERKRMKF